MDFVCLSVCGDDRVIMRLERVGQLNTGITAVRNKVFWVLDFIVHFSHYMFRPHLAAIVRWFANRGRNM
jgi:hypothetical protein